MKKILLKYVDDIMAASGIVIASVGVMLISVPAGMIVLGVLVMASAGIIARGGGGK
ncbi:hypothetical protein [Dialister invisus]|uniref:hypothetical protein n=1 Tax=Dialister invisus TaxID=218538 RepID=UPI0023F6349A|nr:hypothetical protein [Dialister invisus]